MIDRLVAGNARERFLAPALICAFSLIDGILPLKNASEPRRTSLKPNN